MPAQASLGGGMSLMYDPPSGWMYGFPRPYQPLEGETLEQTLLRDGYPQRMLDQGCGRHVRFFGSKAEIDGLQGK
jgi:hypothetical protein